MKKNVVVFSFFCLVTLNACGPAAENREAMHIRAKAFQDSIAFVIKSSMAEAAAPAGGQPVRVDTAVKLSTPPTATTK